MTGLAPGYYEGAVRINSNNGGPVRGAPQDIPVRLWVQRSRVTPKTRITGYVFLDENGNGQEDGGETTRLGGIQVHLLNKAGAVMRVAQSDAGTGGFTFSTMPMPFTACVPSTPIQTWW